jgi:hypothetical protein
MRNVHFHVAPGVVLRIRSLRGEMRSVRGGAIVFDDKRSFELRIRAAEVGLSMSDLSTLLNHFVFNYPGAPLKHLRVRAEGGQLRQTGTLHKVVDIPFDITATLSATSDGRIRLHPTRTRIFHVNGDGLMRALGLRLDKLLDLRKAKGASVRGNDLYLEPDSILPPPTIRGRVTAVRVEGDEVVQVFGTPGARDHDGAQPLTPPDAHAANYMFYRGGTLRFGKLSMSDAEMQIVDLQPDDAFDFDLDRYATQLVAGYSRSLADGGLEVFMPDIGKAGARVATGPSGLPPAGSR